MNLGSCSQSNRFRALFPLVLPLLIVFISSKNIFRLGYPEGYSHTLGLFVLWFISVMICSAPASRPEASNISTPMSVVLILQLMFLPTLEIISAFDFFLKLSPAVIFAAMIFIFAAVVARYGQRLLDGWHQNLENIHWSSLVFSIVAIVIFSFEKQEIPRAVMLSSDPDIHAFHASQILRFMRIPWNQESWGDLPLGYPTGFSGMSALWALISNQDVRNTVTMQPMIQIGVGMGALVEFLILRGILKTSLSRILFTVTIFTFLAVAVPYGRQLGREFLEGTPRLASVGLVLFLITAVFNRPSDETSTSKANKISWFFCCFLACVYLGSMNPSNIVSVTGPALAGALLLGLRQNLKSFPFALLALLVASPILVLDPYFFNLVTNQSKELLSVSKMAKPEPLDLMQFIELGLGAVKQSFSLATIENYLGPEFIPKELGLKLLAGLIVVLSLITVFLKNVRTWAAILNLQLAVSLAAFVFLFPFFEVLSSHSVSLRLLAPYSQTQFAQFLFCWILASSTFIIYCVFQSSNRIISFLAMTVIVGAAFAAKDANPLVIQKPRKHNHGSAGLATENDIKVAKKVENLFLEYMRRNNGAAVPKILISNVKVVTGIEKWLFPVGGQRILYAHHTFPLAFFYFQGSTDYSFENYDAFVCSKFDKNWLLQRSIRYLFVSENSNGCVKDMPLLEKTAKVIFSEGNARFLDFGF